MDRILAAMIISWLRQQWTPGEALLLLLGIVGVARSPEKGRGKDLISKMFGMMLPKGRNS